MIRSPAVRVTVWLVALLTGVAVGGAQDPRDPSFFRGEPDVGVDRDLPAPAGQPLSGAELDAAADDLAAKLRCPVCQGLSVAASPSPSASAMRVEIEELLGLGYSKEQVVAYFERSYGEFVLLAPKAKGFNLVVWAAPVAAVLIGLASILIYSRRRASATVAADDDLEEYRSRVRREVESG